MPQGLALAAIIGAALILIVAVFAMSRNKKHDSKSEIAHTEAATDKLYAEEHAAAKKREGDV